MHALDVQLDAWERLAVTPDCEIPDLEPVSDQLDLARDLLERRGAWAGAVDSVANPSREPQFGRVRLHVVGERGAEAIELEVQFEPQILDAATFGARVEVAPRPVTQAHQPQELQALARLARLKVGDLQHPPNPAAGPRRELEFPR